MSSSLLLLFVLIQSTLSGVLWNSQLPECSFNCTAGLEMYAMCENTTDSAICTNSEIIRSLPNYLIPVYDSTCKNNLSATFLGHVMILYSKSQLLLLGMFSETHTLLDCNTGQRVPIRYPLIFKNIVLDLNPTEILPSGVVALNASNPQQFTWLNESILISEPLPNPVVLGNWSMTSWNPASQWAFSALLSVLVWSPQYQLYRTVNIPISGGTEPLNCSTSNLIRDRLACVTLDRQLRLFNQSTVELIIIEPWNNTDAQWILPEYEQCQQLYGYFLSWNVILKANKTLYPCPNPLVTSATTLNLGELGFVLPLSPQQQQQEGSSHIIGIIVLLGVIGIIILGLVLHVLGVTKRCLQKRPIIFLIPADQVSLTIPESISDGGGSSSMNLDTVRRVLEVDVDEDGENADSD